jgi:hypothetical protein
MTALNKKYWVTHEMVYPFKLSEPSWLLYLPPGLTFILLALFPQRVYFCSLYDTYKEQLFS